MESKEWASGGLLKSILFSELGALHTLWLGLPAQGLAEPLRLARRSLATSSV